MSGPYFVSQPGPIRVQAAQDQQTGVQEYADRLVKLIPTEVIALYTAIRGFLEPSKAAHAVGDDAVNAITSATAASAESAQIQSFLNWWPVICLLLVVFVRAWGARSDMSNWRTVQWPAVIVAAISFIFWVNITGARFFGWDFLTQQIWAALGALWVFLVPYFYKGQ